MKKLLIFLIAFSSGSAWAQDGKYDSIAIYLMDRMSDVIGDLEACSFTVHTSQDINEYEHGWVTYYGTDEVHMLGPDKMLVNSRTYKGHRQYMYNGTQMAYYSFDENNYGIIDAPPTIVEAIDRIHEDYGISFPAADFFYPTFTDDIIALSDEIRYLGREWIDGKESFHLLAKGRDLIVQFWITNDAFTLPYRMSIVYKNQPGSPHFEARFSDWQVNPNLPVSMFEFLPPAGARELTILTKQLKAQ